MIKLPALLGKRVPSRWSLAVLAGLPVIAALAGCTSGEAGQATGPPSVGQSTGESSASSTAPSGSVKSTVNIPPRPANLPLNNVAPCSLFPKQHLDALKVNRPPRAGTDQGAYKGMQECHLNVQNEPPFYSYDILAVTNEGIESWLTGKRNVEAKLTDVGGFAAATYWIRGANGHNVDGCDTSVDVAQGQQLIVGTDNDGNHSFTLEQLCQRAELAAGLAVQTLRTLR